jgi:16S rRNA processing protein RimM
MPKAPANAGQPGSPTKGEPVYLAVGMLRRPHGVRGDLLMEVYTDFPERLTVGSKVLVGENHQPMVIARKREHNDGLLLGFPGIDTPEEAGKYRNLMVFVPAADRPRLPEGEFYYHEILGSKVVDDDSEHVLGELAEIIETGANDVFVVKDEGGREILLPAIEDVIREIDKEGNTIRVHLLPGLVDDAEDI